MENPIYMSIWSNHTGKKKKNKVKQLKEEVHIVKLKNSTLSYIVLCLFRLKGGALLLKWGSMVIQLAIV